MVQANFNTEIKAGLESNHIIDLSDRLYKVMLAIIALVAVFVIGQMSYQFRALPQNNPNDFSVSGEGKAYAKPDIAVMSFGVTSQAASSQDASNQGNTKMNKVIEAIKALGVNDNDIKTTFYNLSPIYGRDQVTVPMASGMGGGGVAMYYPYPGNTKITGYMLEQQVEVKIRDFDKVNQIIDEATSSGANTIGSLQFTVDDMEKVKAEARANAIAKAKEKADALIKQTGLRIEKLVNVSEGYSSLPYAYGMGGGPLAKDSIAPSIQAGQTEVNVTVTLTYRVK